MSNTQMTAITASTVSSDGHTSLYAVVGPAVVGATGAVSASSVESIEGVVPALDERNRSSA